MATTDGQISMETKIVFEATELKVRIDEEVVLRLRENIL
jgi:hypothetical protein